MPRAGQAKPDREVLWGRQETVSNIVLRSCSFILAAQSPAGPDETRTGPPGSRAVGRARQQGQARRRAGAGEAGWEPPQPRAGAMAGLTRASPQALAVISHLKLINWPVGLQKGSRGCNNSPEQRKKKTRAGAMGKVGGARLSAPAARPALAVTAPCSLRTD